MDKDKYGFAFICKKTYFQLANMFLKGNNIRSGIYSVSPIPKIFVLRRLKNYLIKRRLSIPTSPQLMTFKLYFKAHKSNLFNCARPITSEVNGILKSLGARISTALNALRPSLRFFVQSLFLKLRIFRPTQLFGPPVDLAGNFGITSRLNAINLYMKTYFYDLSPTKLETFDLANCYTSLSQEDVISALSILIKRCFSSTRILAINVYHKSGRWIYPGDITLPGEYVYTANILIEDVTFIIKNAYIEWQNVAMLQTKGIGRGVGPSAPICDLYLLY